MWMFHFTDGSSKAHRDFYELPKIMWILRKSEPETILFVNIVIPRHHTATRTWGPGTSVHISFLEIALFGGHNLMTRYSKLEMCLRNCPMLSNIISKILQIKKKRHWQTNIQRTQRPQWSIQTNNKFWQFWCLDSLRTPADCLHVNKPTCKVGPFGVAN